MKNLCIAIIGFLFFPIFCEFSHILYKKYPSYVSEKLFKMSIAPTYNLGDAFVGHCTKNVAQNGHGWIFILRNYYSCNKLEIIISDLIYGEYRFPRDYEKENKVCKKCKH